MNFEQIQTKIINDIDERIKSINNETDKNLCDFLKTYKDIVRGGFLAIDPEVGFRNDAGTKKRSHIIGFMKLDKIAQFIKTYAQEAETIAVHIPSCEHEGSFIYPEFATPLDINSNGDVVRHFTAVISNEDFDANAELIDFDNNENIELIMCYDPKWNRPMTVFNDLLMVLNMI